MNDESKRIKKTTKHTMTKQDEINLVKQLMSFMNSKEALTIVDIKAWMTKFLQMKNIPIDPTKKLTSATAYGFLKRHNELKELFWSKKAAIVSGDDEDLMINLFSYREIPSRSPSPSNEEQKIQELENKVKALEKSLDRYKNIFEKIATKLSLNPKEQVSP
jgi:hypothetical protein